MSTDRKDETILESNNESVRSVVIRVIRGKGVVFGF